MKKIIYILIIFSFSVCFAQKQSIEQAEYFIGNDPGEGKGTALQLTQFGDATVDIKWNTAGVPGIKQGDCIYFRVKSSGLTDNTGKQIPGVWSMPVLMCFPTAGVQGFPLVPMHNINLEAAEAKIVRPGLGYPILKAARATDGKFDYVLDSIRVLISKDSLQESDTVMVRVQGYCDLWSDWVQMPITKDRILSVNDDLFVSTQNGLKIYPNPASTEMNITNSSDIGQVNFTIRNLLGQLVLAGAINSRFLTINVSRLTPGIYMLNVGKETKMFVKE